MSSSAGVEVDPAAGRHDRWGVDGYGAPSAEMRSVSTAVSARLPADQHQVGAETMTVRAVTGGVFRPSVADSMQLHTCPPSGKTVVRGLVLPAAFAATRHPQA